MTQIEKINRINEARNQVIDCNRTPLAASVPEESLKKLDESTRRCIQLRKELDYGVSRVLYSELELDEAYCLKLLKMAVMLGNLGVARVLSLLLVADMDKKPTGINNLAAELLREMNNDLETPEDAFPTQVAACVCELCDIARARTAIDLILKDGLSDTVTLQEQAISNSPWVNEWILDNLPDDCKNPKLAMMFSECSNKIAQRIAQIDCVAQKLSITNRQKIRDVLRAFLSGDVDGCYLNLRGDTRESVRPILIKIIDDDDVTEGALRVISFFDGETMAFDKILVIYRSAKATNGKRWKVHWK